MIEIERILENRMNRRLREEDVFITKLEKKTAGAEKLIGTLIREGKEVFYINVLSRDGKFTGRTKEGSFIEIVDYAIRNHYV
jgi:hypothetical protein